MRSCRQSKPEPAVAKRVRASSNFVHLCSHAACVQAASVLPVPLRSRHCRSAAADGPFELYKVLLAFDNPEARVAHRFPIDPTQKEVKEELDHATGADKAP